MNKLPWFTHDHDAHQDEFLQASMDKFGPFGYSAYFITLELLHKHGSGGILRMGAGRYARYLRSRLDLVKKWLSFCESFQTQSPDHPGTTPKIKHHFIPTQFGEDVEIENKKFIERQRKMKSNAPAMLLQCSANAPLDKEGEREGERHNNLTDSLEPVKPASEPPLLIFQTVGKDKEWHLTQVKVDQYKLSFPAIDLKAECLKARQWLIDNPQKRKTAKGMPKFLYGWLERSQNGRR